MENPQSGGAEGDRVQTARRDPEMGKAGARGKITLQTLCYI